MALGSSQVLEEEFLTALVGDVGISILVLQRGDTKLSFSLSEQLNSHVLGGFFFFLVWGQTSNVLPEFLNLRVKLVLKPLKHQQQFYNE